MNNVYLIRAQHGSRRYWRAKPCPGLACTHEELPREVARRLSVPLAHVVALNLMPSLEVARDVGREWQAGRP